MFGAFKCVIRYEARGHQDDTNTLNQLLTEMDGLKSTEKDSVLIIASTNRIDVLDEAILRGGRFDRQIMIRSPTQQGRVELFKKYLEQYTVAANVTNLAKWAAAVTPRSVLSYVVI
jgi:ATP-dependent Zn protease